MYGSCISTMSQFLLCTLLISSLCAVFDLLRLICKIRRGGLWLAAVVVSVVVRFACGLPALAGVGFGFEEVA